MTELRQQLQDAVGATYRIERELGGGGMSRVFLAEEVELGRPVVVKVLPPEMAAGVNQDRFRREIQLAAKLQHSHIVPVLTAGSAGDLLYYVMPFIEGESLRAKLAREGELPVAEAAKILREVTDALAYAHERGIVHRDIKPDNVMLSSGHAVVTDFGVAKAVSESTGASSLTSLGVALGTPAYMAPEQASGDPHVDHRADLYALGAMAFEMLAGRPPFSAPSPQAMLAAQVTRTPERISTLRPAVPPGLETVVMRCLEKRPADRWQKATELMPFLDAVLSPSSGMQPTAAAYTISSGTAAALERSHPVRVATLVVLASIGILAVVYLIVQWVGLPDWVLFAAVGLLVLELPVVLLTGRHERRRAMARAARTELPTPVGLHKLLTWRRMLRGGALAFAGLGLLAAVYMVLRGMGVGPFGTLMAKGVLGERDRVVVAEFENFTNDSTLAGTITELFRIDLSQSPTLSVYDQAQTAAVLARMQRPPDAELTFDLAREVASREGLKAVLAGEIRPLGEGFVVSARLVATGTGEILWAARQDVSGTAGLSAGVDKLSDALRAKAGESLRTIRADPPLDQVTTKSLEALHAYGEAEDAQNRGDQDAGIALLRRAIAQDSGFAMAYRKLGILLGNRGMLLGGRVLPADSAAQRQAFTKAYKLRDHLTTRERGLTEAAYFLYVTSDTTAAMAAYQSVLDNYPDDYTALNNLGGAYFLTGREADALALFRRSVDLGAAPAVTYQGAIEIEYRVGSPDTARQILTRYAQAFPGSPNVDELQAAFAVSEARYDSAEAIYQALRSDARGSPWREGPEVFQLATLAGVRGQLNAAVSLALEAMRLLHQAGMPVFQESGPEDAIRPLIRARLTLEYLGDSTAAIHLDEEALRLYPLERREAADRQAALDFADFYARAGEPARATELLRHWEASVGDSVRRDPPAAYYNVTGAIAIAEGRPSDAVSARLQARRRSPPLCVQCFLYEIAESYDQANEPDSAIAYYERDLNARVLGRINENLPRIYRRLGALYEAEGDHERALDYYGKFVDLWKGADPELQPQVKAIRDRMAELGGEPHS